jgi:DNA invertase Pin-like site-specific DNA recombinase
MNSRTRTNVLDTVFRREVDRIRRENTRALNAAVEVASNRGIGVVAIQSGLHLRCMPSDLIEARTIAQFTSWDAWVRFQQDQVERPQRENRGLK